MEISFIRKREIKKNVRSLHCYKQLALTIHSIFGKAIIITFFLINIFYSHIKSKKNISFK